VKEERPASSIEIEEHAANLDRKHRIEVTASIHT
jgi:hypothetical protein